MTILIITLEKFSRDPNKKFPEQIARTYYPHKFPLKKDDFWTISKIPDRSIRNVVFNAKFSLKMTIFERLQIFLTGRSETSFFMHTSFKKG